MSKLGALREQINIQDDLIIKHIAERVRLAKEIRLLKAEQGLPHPDKVRELEVLAEVAHTASEFSLSEQHVKTVFEAIMDLTKHEQEVFMKTREGG